MPMKESNSSIGGHQSSVMAEKTEPVFNSGGTGLEGRVLGREEPVED